MKKNLPNMLLLVFVGVMSLSLSSQNVHAQSPSPTLTPSPSLIPSPTLALDQEEATANTTSTKGGDEDLPESLPVAGAYDQLIIMLIGGVMMFAIAGVLRVKMTELVEENQE